MGLVISGAIRSKLLNKHDVSEREILQCFENRDGGFLTDTREQHRTDPPTKWFVSETNKRRKLKVCFILKENDVIIKTAYDANQAELEIYEKLGRK